MIANPFPGQPVQLHYRAEMRPLMPFHGQRGIVVQCCHGRPRNHLVKVGHRHVVVPCGNLIPPNAPTSQQQGDLFD